MAQALDEKVPPFLLQMYGTNGSFTACDVIRRWKYTKAELAKYSLFSWFDQQIWLFNFLFDLIFRYGIELRGISSDGDSKLLCAMKYENSLLNGIAVTQDPIHISGKARNRLLKHGIKLPMETHEVSVGHLKKLVKDVQKSVHGLTYYDVYPIDRMNYTSFEKIVQDRVIDALSDRVPGSTATAQYLLTFRDIDRSFSSLTLEPLDRVYLMYRGLFFLRIWRAWIKASRSYNLSDNYITSNTNMCVEINAKNLLRLMKEQRDRNEHEMFLPILYDSQTCENTFRMYRSLGTTKFTKINFNLLELIHMIGRIEVQNEIAYVKLNVEGIAIPHKRRGKMAIYQLPTDEDINNSIKKAKQDAIQIADSFGMTFTNIDEIDDFKFESKLKLKEDTNANAMESEEIDGESQLSDDEVDVCENSECDVSNVWGGLENESEAMDVDLINDDHSRRLTKVLDENGEEQMILKSTLVWSLTEPGIKMSNDRTKRFRYK